MYRLRRLLVDCKRVLKVAIKPGKKSYLYNIKITAFGMLLVGAMGYIIFVIASLLIELG